MSPKTKILSLILMGLLVLPVLIGSQPSGNVLGVLESNTTSSKSFNQLGEIGSGAIEVKTANQEQDKTQIYKGRVVWDANAKSPVSTDKFSLGSSINVQSGTKSINLVVGDVRSLSPDTLMVVNEDTYTKLGGDLQSDQPLEVSVTLD